MRKMLYILFLVIVAILLFEGGFYFGVNFYKTDSTKSETSQNREITPLPSLTNSETSWYIQLSNFKPIFKTKDNVNINSKPAISANRLSTFMYPLFSADSGLVKEASMSYTLKGKIVKLEKVKGSLPFKTITDIKDFYLLKLENLQTSSVVDIYINLNKINQDLNSFHIGDVVEVNVSVDFLGESYLTIVKLT